MIKNLNQMTESEITKLVFKGIGVSTPRGLRDVFSDDQINQIIVFIRNLKPDEEPQNP